MIQRAIHHIRWRLSRRKAFAAFAAEFEEFRRLNSAAGARLAVDWKDRYPFFHERTEKTDIDRHYIYHTAWAARILEQLQPKQHVDISSSLYFVGIVSAFLPVQFYDYRPAELHLSNLNCGAADLTKLHFADKSIPSLSCMHVIEHIGLGRYGDPLDPDGDMKSLRELQRVLAPGGSLLLAMPVGRPRVCFNAHRVYSFRMIPAALPELRLHQFSFVPDVDSPNAKGLIPDAPQELCDSQDYGCGCFWFKRD